MSSVNSARTKAELITTLKNRISRKKNRNPKAIPPMKNKSLPDPWSLSMDSRTAAPNIPPKTITIVKRVSGSVAIKVTTKGATPRPRK